jgi:hypothetical protein
MSDPAVVYLMGGLINLLAIARLARLEGDHGKLKRLIQPTLGFQSMKTAYATIKGFEVMRMFKKGQFAPWIDAICGGTKVHFINRLFGLYA